MTTIPQPSLREKLSGSIADGLFELPDPSEVQGDLLDLNLNIPLSEEDWGFRNAPSGCGTKFVFERDVLPGRSGSMRGYGVLQEGSWSSAYIFLIPSFKDSDFDSLSTQITQTFDAKGSCRGERGQTEDCATTPIGFSVGRRDSGLLRVSDYDECLKSGRYKIDVESTLLINSLDTRLSSSAPFISLVTSNRSTSDPIAYGSVIVFLYFPDIEVLSLAYSVGIGDPKAGFTKQDLVNITTQITASLSARVTRSMEEVLGQ